MLLTIVWAFAARFYAFQVYQAISASFGGGSGTIVRLVADGEDLKVLCRSGIRFSESLGLSEKVYVTFETEKTVFVTLDPYMDPSENEPEFSCGEKGEWIRMVEVDKALIKAIVSQRVWGPSP
jgi:hypothetical protein